MWPLSVAVESGRCLRTRRDEKPGIVASSLLCSSARSKVMAGGEQRAWWINRAYSATVEVASMLAAIVVGITSVGAPVGVGIGRVDVVRGIIHRPVRVHLLVHRTVR